MSWGKFMERYQLIIALSLIVVIMAGIKLVYGKQYWEDQAIKQILPISPTSQADVNSPIPSPTATMSNEEKYPLWRILPYQTKEFTIEQYQKPLTLTVKIKSGTKESVENKINSWLIQNQVDPQSHLIEWEK